MSAKSKKSNSALRIGIFTILIIILMLIASMSGIYFARFFVTPYSEIVNEFHEDTLTEVEISKDKFTVLLLGTDKSGLLTDVMMLAQVNPDTNKVTVMSIPRDTRIKYNGKWMKMNQPHSIGQKKNKMGSETAILAVKELTGIPINHFIKINFSAFRKSIDELGGVDFNVPQRMKYSDPYQDLYIDLQPGMQHLDGDKAEQLVRFRRYKLGDIDRIKVQQDFLHELVSQKLKFKYIGKIDNIYDIVSEDMETSLSPQDAVKVARQILEIGGENINTITLPSRMQDISGVSYVIPLYDEIETLRKETFEYEEDIIEFEKK